MKTALIFSGQGSQYVGMMKDLYENSDLVRNKIEHSNRILDYNLSEICFNGPSEVLKETRYTQPALFLHSSLLFDLLPKNLSFNAVAGHSVGEYSALYSAGVLSFEDGLKLVALRGKLMFEIGKITPGTMAAVIGLEDEKVDSICKGIKEKTNQEIIAANFNSPGQIVISGHKDTLLESFNEFKSAGARLIKELPVSGAFHSNLMLPAQNELEMAIKNTNFNDAKYPVYVNVDASPYHKADVIKDMLINQLVSPVKWTQTLNTMHKDEITRYIELGPGNVLQGLVKRTLENVDILGVDKFHDIENIK